MSEKEYIERGALIEKLKEKITTNYLNLYDEDTLESTIRLAEKQPAAPVEPVVRGEWVPNKRHDGCMACDQCGFGIETKTIVFMDCNRTDNEREFVICISDARLAHCPNCGAHMMERSGSGE